MIFNWYIVKCIKDIDITIRKNKVILFEISKFYEMRMYEDKSIKVFCDEFAIFLPKNMWQEHFKIIKKGKLKNEE